MPVSTCIQHSMYFDSVALMLVARETGILPRLNTGIAHRVPGVGMIGAGILRAPAACFDQASDALAEQC